ncbi:hypothetical protein [uncultured Tateyamaria sp.]|uniref:hypothetical protein n=1 Tax=uncultured Tateyamaria sp. TaxID=455651 RepID=UPI0026129754|nr:hypothetical protein [uncultured Tateyamaria sp.]
MGDDTTGNRVGSLSLGVTVVTLYVLFVMLVTLGFGSYIYRTAWQSEPMRTQIEGDTAAAGQDADIDNMIFILRREQNLEYAKLQLAGSLRDLREQVADYEARILLSYGPINRDRETLRVQADLIVADLTEYQYALQAPARSKYELVFNQTGLGPHTRVTSLISVVEEGIGDADLDADSRDAFTTLANASRLKLDDLLAALERTNKASHDLQQERDVVKNQITALEAQRGQHDERIMALRQVLPIGSVTRARLAALSMNIPLIPDVLMRLVSFPTIFLTLIVTIAAGGLGTVVAFSRRYYSSVHADTLTLSRLFVNVGEGIAAAIAIFLFSGAGMLALTQGGGTANDVELSPYTVAFIAFLSGFMAEDAFASIQSAGKRIFKRDTPNESEVNVPPPEAGDPA